MMSELARTPRTPIIAESPTVPLQYFAASPQGLNRYASIIFSASKQKGLISKALEQSNLLGQSFERVADCISEAEQNTRNDLCELYQQFYDDQDQRLVTLQATVEDLTNKHDDNARKLQSEIERRCGVETHLQEERLKCEELQRTQLRCTQEFQAAQLTNESLERKCKSTQQAFEESCSQKIRLMADLASLNSAKLTLEGTVRRLEEQARTDNKALDNLKCLVDSLSSKNIENEILISELRASAQTKAAELSRLQASSISIASGVPPTPRGGITSARGDTRMLDISEQTTSSAVGDNSSSSTTNAPLASLPPLTRRHFNQTVSTGSHTSAVSPSFAAMTSASSVKIRTPTNVGQGASSQDSTAPLSGIQGSMSQRGGTQKSCDDGTAVSKDGRAVKGYGKRVRLAETASASGATPSEADDFHVALETCGPPPAPPGRTHGSQTRRAREVSNSGTSQTVDATSCNHMGGRPPSARGLRVKLPDGSAEAGEGPSRSLRSRTTSAPLRTDGGRSLRTRQRSADIADSQSGLAITSAEVSSQGSAEEGIATLSHAERKAAYSRGASKSRRLTKATSQSSIATSDDGAVSSNAPCNSSAPGEVGTTSTTSLSAHTGAPAKGGATTRTPMRQRLRPRPPKS